MRVGVDHHLRGDHDDAQMTIEEEHLEEITEEEQNKRRKSKCNVANAILHAFEEQSNTNAGAFFFLHGWSRRVSRVLECLLFECFKFFTEEEKNVGDVL
jgi:hypothetical protein